MTTSRAWSAEHVDGRLFPVTEEDVTKGACLRMVNKDGSAPPFSDFLVLDVRSVDKFGVVVRPEELGAVPVRNRRVTLARPYALVSGAETSCPSVLTGVERVTVDMDRLVHADSHFRVLVTARGNVHTHAT